MEDRPWPLESNTTSMGEREREKKLEVLSRQKVELFIQTIQKGVHHI